MKNCPWHEEVIAFCNDLVSAIGQIEGCPKYQIASEHEHSCCVLIANKEKFKIAGVWWVVFSSYSVGEITELVGRSGTRGLTSTVSMNFLSLPWKADPNFLLWTT